MQRFEDYMSGAVDFMRQSAITAMIWVLMVGAGLAAITADGVVSAVVGIILVVQVFGLLLLLAGDLAVRIGRGLFNRLKTYGKAHSVSGAAQ